MSPAPTGAPSGPGAPGAAKRARPGSQAEDGSWHARSADQALRLLAAERTGLTEREARARQDRFGPNSLAPPRRASAPGILLDQFRSVVVLLLAAAALVSLLIGDVLEAVAIAAVLAVNTAIGFAVELRARRAMEALLRFETPAARVFRDGELREVTADRLVPGDVIELQSGDAVPADARLLWAAEVRAIEASLTGESAPADKALAAVAEATPLAERSPMLYCGTTLCAGQARALVVATGAATELGRIGTLLAGIEEESTPLERRLDALGRRLVGFAVGIAALIVGLGVARGVPFGPMLETGIALAIAAVPEGLPAVATIALAVGLGRMARRHALVRRLSAVEALGSTTVVCTDKTGTLTAGEMTVTRLGGPDFTYRVTGAGFTGEGAVLDRAGEPVPASDPSLGRLLRAAALTSRAVVDPVAGLVSGDPTDGALSVLARKAASDGADAEAGQPLIEEIPFSSERQLSAAVHGLPDGCAAVYAKGAPGAILDRCRRVATARGERDLDAASRGAIEEKNEEWARDGLRVIALAYGEGELPGAGRLEGLTFLGLAGIIDPPASGVRETIDLLHRAGIRTVMMTGDQGATAETIGRQLGVLEPGGRTLGGRDLLDLDEDALAAAAPAVAIYSRVTPEDKLKIVAALQRRGEVVAMLGDGVNDAAALKKADVGVAMGLRGTDVAKQTAAVVLQDDRFPTIAAAVEEGRVIFDNIRKFVFYLFSCNLAEVLVLLAASVAGLPLPLLPLQILWLNLVTDTFPALALAMEPAEPGVMERPPRDPDAGILSPSFVRALVFYAALITMSTLAAYLWALETGRGRQAVTISFVTLALAQLFHLGNARSRSPVLKPRRAFANRWAIASVPLVLGLQWLAVHVPALQRVLRTVPLGLTEWAIILALASLPAVIGQLIEVAQGRRRAPATAGRA